MLATKFFSVSFLEKRLFVEAYILLGIMRAAILTISFKRLTSSLNHYQFIHHSEMPEQKDRQSVQLIRKAIRRAARRTPWESACLVQSLVARIMLQKRDIPGVIYLGVAAAQTEKTPLKAHAWSQCGDIIVTGQNGHDNFKVMSTFSWK